MDAPDLDVIRAREYARIREEEQTKRAVVAAGATRSDVPAPGAGSVVGLSSRSPLSTCTARGEVGIDATGTPARVAAP
ncbi:hypothetical protein ACFFTQ_06605 [Streptomyces roseofulvus]|uniref:hypothetical protein n=1 Tax=Streptomyces roseofulvus TaxID=33902 RepID=UPI0031F86D49